MLGREVVAVNSTASGVLLEANWLPIAIALRLLLLLMLSPTRYQTTSEEEEGSETLVTLYLAVEGRGAWPGAGADGAGWTG